MVKEYKNIPRNIISNLNKLFVKYILKNTNFLTNSSKHCTNFTNALVDIMPTYVLDHPSNHRIKSLYNINPFLPEHFFSLFMKVLTKVCFGVKRTKFKFSGPYLVRLPRYENFLFLGFDKNASLCLTYCMCLKCLL